ncbi:hypothetical protein ACOSQ4_026982 [Xanthoceras sorbifolium]
MFAKRFKKFLKTNKKKGIGGCKEINRGADFRCTKGWVTFGNGSKKKVIGKGSIKISGLPSLNDALLVDGLHANLISITHLCDSVHAVELWHQRLGHLNFKDLKKLGKMKAVRGLPELGKKQEGVCGPCQIGKQTKGIHKKNKGTMSKRKKPNISYFHTFGSKCYILNDRDQLGKFDAKMLIKPCSSNVKMVSYS